MNDYLQLDLKMSGIGFKFSHVATPHRFYRNSNDIFVGVCLPCRTIIVSKLSIIKKTKLIKAPHILAMEIIKELKLENEV